MCHEKLKEAFLQGREREAAVLFRQMMKGVVRLGLFGAMKEEVDSLCGRRYQPDPHSDYQRADADRLFKSLREAQGKEAGEEAFDNFSLEGNPSYESWEGNPFLCTGFFVAFSPSSRYLSARHGVQHPAGWVASTSTFCLEN